MLKLYKYTCGLDEKFGPAMDDQDAYDRRAEVDPTFDFVGVRIEEVVVPGFEIVIYPEGTELNTLSASDEDPDADPNGSVDVFEAMDRAELVTWLKANDVEYVPQWGEARLRETARAAAKELIPDGE